MITISGAVNRSFIFPARRPEAFRFFADTHRSLSLLPHISIQDQHSDNGFRLVYRATELGLYSVRLTCDIQVALDYENWVLDIFPMEGVSPVANEAGIYSLSAQGVYKSRSKFFSQGNETRIEYRLSLSSRMPKVLSSRFIPDFVVKGVAQSVAEWRMDEIVDTFINRSIDLYQSTSTEGF